MTSFCLTSFGFNVDEERKRQWPAGSVRFSPCLGRACEAAGRVRVSPSERVWARALIWEGVLAGWVPPCAPS